MFGLNLPTNQETLSFQNHLYLDIDHFAHNKV